MKHRISSRPDLARDDILNGLPSTGGAFTTAWH